MTPDGPQRQGSEEWELTEFDAEDAAFEAAARPLNIQVPILAELQPATRASEVFAYDGRKVTIAWNTTSGTALAVFDSVVVFRHGLPRGELVGPAGLSVFKNSDLIQQRSSWADNTLSTSDSFSLVHWAIRFEKNQRYEQDRIFECAASHWIDYIHTSGVAPSELLWSYRKRPDPCK